MGKQLESLDVSDLRGRTVKGACFNDENSELLFVFVDGTFCQLYSSMPGLEDNESTIEEFSFVHLENFDLDKLEKIGVDYRHLEPIRKLRDQQLQNDAEEQRKMEFQEYLRLKAIFEPS